MKHLTTQTILSFAALLLGVFSVAQSEETSNFLDDLVIDEPIAVASDARDDGLRLAIISWGDFDADTTFDIAVAAKPGFVKQAVIAEGSSIVFEPEEVEKLITLMLTLEGEGEGDLILEVRPQAPDIQPGLRRIVLPLTRGPVTADIPKGDSSFFVCLADADPEASSPGECKDNNALFPTDDIWVRWDTGYTEKSAFEWRLMGPVGKYPHEQGTYEYGENSIATDSRFMMIAPDSDYIRVEIRTQASMSGEYRLQYRDQVDQVISPIFGVGRSHTTFKGEWQDLGAYNVDPALVTFKAFLLPPVSSFKSGETTNGNIRPGKVFHDTPQIEFDATASWDFKRCGDEIISQQSTARIGLSMPPELNLGLPLNPGSSGMGMGSLTSAILNGTDYYRDESPPELFSPLSASVNTVTQGFAQMSMCDDWGRVSFSLAFGDLNFTTRSLASVSVDDPLQAGAGGLSVLYKSPKPFEAEYRYSTRQKGHDFVRGPVTSIDMEMRVIRPGGTFGEPNRRLGDHLRDENTQFAIPIELHLTAWEGTKNPSHVSVGRPMIGYAIYGSSPGPYAGAQPLGDESDTSGITADAGIDSGATAPSTSQDSGSSATEAGTAAGTGNTDARTGSGAAAATVAATASSGATSGPVDQEPDGGLNDRLGEPSAQAGSTTVATPSSPSGDAGITPESDPAPVAGVSGTIQPPVSITVANVVGRSASDARTTLERQGLAVTLAIGPPAPSTGQNETVMRAQPAAGTRLWPGDPVELVIYSAAQISLVIPDLMGSDAADARARLIDEGFAVNAALGAPATTAAAADTVQNLRPAPGTRVEPGAQVTMIIYAPFVASTAGPTPSGSSAVTNSSDAPSSNSTDAALIEANKPGYYVARIWGEGYRITFGAPAHIVGEQIALIRPVSGKTLSDRINDWLVYMRGSTDACNPGPAPLCPCAPSPYIWKDGPWLEIIDGPYSGFGEAWKAHECDKSNINTSMLCNRWVSEPDGRKTIQSFKDFRRTLGCPIK